MKNKVDLFEKKSLLNSYFQVEEALLSFERFDGSMSPMIRRLNLKRPDVSACLLYNPILQSLLLIKQFRYPAYTKQKGWLLEVPAGVVDPGEKPEDTVCREVFEETGYSITNPILVCHFFTSPGISSERCFLFSAPILQEKKKNKNGGLLLENEDIQLGWFSLKKVKSMLKNQEIIDAKTILAIQWFLLNQGLFKT